VRVPRRFEAIGSSRHRRRTFGGVTRRFCRDAFTTMINNRAAPGLARDKGFARKTMTSNSPTDRQSALRQVELGRAGAVALNVIVRTIER
jgi:hypothetical protein